MLAVGQPPLLRERDAPQGRTEAEDGVVVLSHLPRPSRLIPSQGSSWRNQRPRPSKSCPRSRSRGSAAR